MGRPMVGSNVAIILRLKCPMGGKKIYITNESNVVSCKGAWVKQAYGGKGRRGNENEIFSKVCQTRATVYLLKKICSEPRGRVSQIFKQWRESW